MANGVTFATATIDEVERALTPPPGTVRLRRMLGHRSFVIAGVILAIIVALAAAAPLVSPHDPYAQNLANRLVPPVFMDGGSWEHPLGTDALGRDYMSRVVYGARVSLLIGVLTALMSGIIGAALGVTAGYFGGKVDSVICYILAVRLSMPVVLIALAVVSLVGGSLTAVIMVMGLLLWDRYAVVMRSATQQVRALDYVAAAAAVGASTPRIVLTEVFPNVLNNLIIVATFEVAHAILLEAALSFLGLGVQPPLPSWGLMIAEGRQHLLFEAWVIVIPGLALSILVLAVNMVGDGIRDIAAPETAADVGTLLEVRDLVVDIPLAAGMLHPVRGVTFSVERGETLCIVGESGCGKSLTALALMALLPRRAKRAATRLALDGIDLLTATEDQLAELRGSRMAMIFQEPMTSLNPAYTIGNQLEEMLIRHRKATRTEARERALFLLEKVGITAALSRLSQYPHQLSGGLRQRVMIAMALMCGPDLMIADEPTTALDVTIQAQILLLLAQLRREFGMGLVLITHDLGIVARVAERVAVMYAGQIVEQGTAADVFRHPRHPYTRGLMRCIPVPGKVARGSPLGSIPGMVPSLIGAMSGCSFRERCGFRRDACEAEIALVEYAGGHAARCVLSAEEIASAA